MPDAEVPDDVKAFQNFLIERIKETKSPELLLTILIMLTLDKDELDALAARLKMDNN